MSKTINPNKDEHLRQEILQQCTWSERYSSLKHIFKRTVNQLPLLVSYPNKNNEQQTTYDHNQTILFFHRNTTSKLLFWPLQQRDEQLDQFDIYPNHCIFAMTNFYKGLFEFVRNGQRCSQIFTNLEQLINFASNVTYSIVFMSRDRALVFYQNTTFSHWSSKKYNQGAIFRAKCIHHSSVSSNSNQQTSDDYLECLDEDDYNVFLKMDQPGRYSIIAISAEQQEVQPEIYLHSIETPNIGRLIKRLTNNDTCIRLVRGSLSHNCACQYFRFIHQRTYDVLVGITQEDLVIEWNIECRVPCSYATNLNHIIDSMHGTNTERTFKSYVDRAQKRYTERFQSNMQLISSDDWTAFFQYWKWTGCIQATSQDENNATCHDYCRFHLVASIQDLSRHSQKLISSFKNFRELDSNSSSLNRFNPTRHKKLLTSKQATFLSQMSRAILPTRHSEHHINRLPRQSQRSLSFLLTHTEQPFDDSIYDSNQIHLCTPNDNSMDRTNIHKQKHS